MGYAQQALKFPPGSRWEYSNAGINTLGRIVEVVSGQPYAEFLERRLFQPLGMKDTTFWPTPAQAKRIANSYQNQAGGSGLEETGIYFIQGGLSDRLRPAYPAGGLFSTAADVARFYQMMLSDGIWDGQRLLSSAAVAQMTRTQTGDIKTGFVDGMSWGLGFQVVKEPQGVTGMLSPGTFGHGGAYGTQSWADPQRDLVLVMMIQRAGLPNGDASDMRRVFQQSARVGQVKSAAGCEQPCFNRMSAHNHLMNRALPSGLLVAFLAVCPTARATSAAELSGAIETIGRVGPEGRGNAEASLAWKQLATAPAADLPTILAAMDGASDLTRNWLRAAVETIVARETAAGHSLPLAELESFLNDRQHNGRARRLAFDLIARIDPAQAQRLIAGMLDDPAGELRREAVQRLIDEAAQLNASKDSDTAKARYREALQAARDTDQVEAIAKALRALGETPDLRRVFGWVTRWQVIGPFDNTGLAGFAAVYPPEHEIQWDAEYDGKSGKVRWRDFETQDEYGVVDLNKPLGALKEVTGYAFAGFETAKAQPAEIRLGSENAWKVWFNGQFLFGRDEYHRGREIDQYRLPVQLKAGRNTILVKVCQDQEVEEWTVEWQFQLRVTDSLGTPIQPAAEGATPAKEDVR